MKRILSICVFLGTLLSCEPTLDGGVDLIGKWEIRNGSFSYGVFEFENKNTLTIYEGDEASSYYYKLYHDNTIQIEYGIINGRYDIITHTSDSIEILGFTISGIPEERNTLLKRIH